MSRHHLARTTRPAALIVLLAATSAQAWPRRPYEDAEVVARSELIVVGHLEPGSSEFVLHPSNPYGGRSYEHHARLIITEVFKGDLKATTIPIIIHYGLTPVVGGYARRDGFTHDLRHGRDDYPKDIIEILDTGSAPGAGSSLVKDAPDG